MLEIYDNNNNDDGLLIWACENRNSNKIMIVLADKSCCNANDMFDNKAWQSARYFDANDYDTAIDFTYNVIENNLIKILQKNIILNLRRINAQLIYKEQQWIQKDLNYEDYYNLATFEDVDKLYFCNLIVSDGKLGLRYSKYSEKYYNEFDNHSFEEWEPDLTSNVTLMLGMQERLNNFIEKELDYDISVGIGIQEEKFIFSEIKKYDKSYNDE